MLRLSKDRERSTRWQRVAQLLLAKADVGAVSRQLELALVYDGKLDVRAMAWKPERTFTFRVDTWTPESLPETNAGDPIGARNAAESLGLQLHILNASTEREIETAFANLAQLRAGALLISAEAFFYSRRLEFIALTARQALPAMYAQGEYVTAGGLISYGFNYAEYISK
jgi:hypothetical protein